MWTAFLFVALAVKLVFEFVELLELARKILSAFISAS